MESSYTVHLQCLIGALLTALAAKQLSALEMNQIEVIAFGGAAALRQTPQTPFRRCLVGVAGSRRGGDPTKVGLFGP